MKEKRKLKSKRLPYGALKGGGYEGYLDSWTLFVNKTKARLQGKKDIREQLEN